MQKEIKNRLEIYDNENNLLALKLILHLQQNDKEFHTSNEQSLQLGTFNLQKGESLERHVHLENERTIYNTSEVILVTKGKVKVEIFDKNKIFVTEQIINTSELILFFQGGHSFEILEDAKFVEVKQGPYIEGQDKKRF
tara:strand:+ start:352 stop:768 length:417 start_codon:yes stop_codon:yes gene_type:complete